MKIRSVGNIVFNAPQRAADAFAMAKMSTFFLRPRGYHDCLAAHVETNAEVYADEQAVFFEGATYTWAELNTWANRYAAALRASGIKRGDAVCLMMENRTEYLAALFALNKLGAVPALVNTNLTGRPLAHCINIIESRQCIVGEECVSTIAEIRGELESIQEDGYWFVPDLGESEAPDWSSDLEAAAADADPLNPQSTHDVSLDDVGYYTFTSGTTGLPKAAKLTHRRFMGAAGMSHYGGLRCTQEDCIYLCLPLYHGTGLLMGVGAACLSGARMVIRRRFSASGFLPDVREHGVTCFVYIGELCRYLLATPAQPDDADNPLRVVMGNGLRPDIWMEFKERFGIERVSEHYGSSEGNVGFINLLNKDRTIGLAGSTIALVEYDVDRDEVVRNQKGRCVRVAKGESGLLLGKITKHNALDGYTDKEATESKILRNVLKKGDAWFNTGDLVKTVDVGFSMGIPHYQFVDRVGDTFRWKSENVSTNEVGEIINSHPQVQLCNVYGVEIPGTDGRAGMGAIVLAGGVEELDLADLSAHVNRELPAYARPVFLRIEQQADTTGTFKLAKGELRSQGYDPDKVTDILYVLKPKSTVYEPLDENFHASILASTAGY